MAADDSLLCLTPGARKARGFVPMREPGFTAVRLEVVGGRADSGAFAHIARIAAEFARGYIHLTTRQGIEIPHVPNERLDEVAAALNAVGLRPGGCGPRVRTVVACPGMDCRWGVIDAQGLAQKLAASVRERMLPHKFKVAVTGCPNGCAKPIENDFGVQGVRLNEFDRAACCACGACADSCPVAGVLSVETGELVWNREQCIGCGKCVAACPTGAWSDAGEAYAILVGGKMGRTPRLATRLPELARSEQEVVGLLDRVLTWYSANGRSKERFGDTIARVGLGPLVAALGMDGG